MFKTDILIRGNLCNPCSLLAIKKPALIKAGFYLFYKSLVITYKSDLIVRIIYLA